MSRLNVLIHPGIRFDEGTGAVRSFFHADTAGYPAGVTLSAASVADEFLAENLNLFNLSGISLVLAGVKDGSSQTTCRYEQYQDNIPVYGAYIQIILRKTSQQVISAINKLDYQIPPDLGEASVRISPERALELLFRRFDKEYRQITHSPPVLCFRNQELVWRIYMDTLHPKGYWEVLIHAIDGSFKGQFDRRRFLATCPAKIFRPDPVTSSRNPFLNKDSQPSLLDKELMDVVLENLDDPMDSIYRLQGKWVRIADLESPVMTLPGTVDAFNYTSGDRNLLSVMAYYYLDRLVDWLRSLEIPACNDAVRGPIEVDAQAVNGEDNSHFVVPLSGQPYIAFGEGGTPDASDPGVIVHEFGHALHYFLLGGSIQNSPFEEGFNDVLSCVFRDRFNVHGFDRANPFPWDNNKTVNWDPSRRCDVDLRFDDPDYHSYDTYVKGTIYATALWNIYLEFGGNSENALDRLQAAGAFTGTCIDMLIALGDTGPVEDLANGLILSDYCRTGGRYADCIRIAFSGRGLPLK